jgi:protein-L-isoaspartate(D-aspartate) O-methyltransferase
MDAYTKKRHDMVETQIVARGIHDPAVVQAMRTVPREAFVAPELQECAYKDKPLPIEAGQTISQPYMVALMIAALQPQPQHHVLEIGTGSGYAAAVLSRVVREVYTIERHAELVELARRRLHILGYDNVHVLYGNGALGWIEYAPYDGIVVTASSPKIPDALLEQLILDGRLVIPVGAEGSSQCLVRVTRESNTSYRRDNLGGVRFVPLVSAPG